LRASTTALPPTYLHGERPTSSAAVFLLQGRPTVGRSCVLRPEPGGESAGCVRLQLPCSAGSVACSCLVQQAVLPAIALFSRRCCLQLLFSRLCFACHLLPAMPTALISSCPRSVCLPPSILLHCALPLFISMCARITVVRASSLLLGPAVCKLQDCPVGSCNTGLQWRPVRRSIC